MTGKDAARSTHHSWLTPSSVTISANDAFGAESDQNGLPRDEVRRTVSDA